MLCLRDMMLLCLLFLQEVTPLSPHTPTSEWSHVCSGLLLSPGGEFAFVLFGEAVARGIMGTALAKELYLVVALRWGQGGGQWMEVVSMLRSWALGQVQLTCLLSTSYHPCFPTWPPPPHPATLQTHTAAWLSRPSWPSLAAS